MGKASITTITTTKITTRTAGLDLMDASLAYQAGSIQECSEMRHRQASFGAWRSVEFWYRYGGVRLVGRPKFKDGSEILRNCGMI